MITITITSDVTLTDPRLEPIHRAAMEIAELHGEAVRIVSELTVCPKIPVAPQIDAEESAQYVGSGLGDDDIIVAPAGEGWIKTEGRFLQAKPGREFEYTEINGRMFYRYKA